MGESIEAMIVGRPALMNQGGFPIGRPDEILGVGIVWQHHDWTSVLPLESPSTRTHGNLDAVGWDWLELLTERREALSHCATP